MKDRIILKTETIKIGSQGKIEIYLGGNDAEVGVALMEIILKLNDHYNEYGEAAVKNAFWMTLFDCITEKLQGGLKSD